MLPGSRFSHASWRAAARSFEQWSRMWDLVMRFLWQNQHSSSLRFLILFKKTAERQWSVRICVATRAMAFRAPCRHDFLRGGRDGVRATVLRVLVPRRLCCIEPLGAAYLKVGQRRQHRGSPGLGRSLQLTSVA